MGGLPAAFRQARMNDTAQTTSAMAAGSEKPVANSDSTEDQGITGTCDGAGGCGGIVGSTAGNGVFGCGCDGHGSTRGVGCQGGSAATCRVSPRCAGVGGVCNLAMYWRIEPVMARACFSGSPP